MKRNMISVLFYATVVCMSFATFAVADTAAEQSLVSTDETLIVNGWRMVYPSFVVNKKTGETTSIGI